MEGLRFWVCIPSLVLVLWGAERKAGDVIIFLGERASASKRTKS